jgi:RND family efflux transporter MFP subunit
VLTVAPRGPVIEHQALPQHPASRWSALALSLCLGCAIALPGCGGKSDAELPHRGIPAVTVVHPVRREMARRVTMTGDVLGIRQAELTAKVPGFLDKIYVDRGDFVHEGQLLAILTYPEQEALYKKAKANLELAELNYKRMQKLAEQHVVAEQDLDNARTNFQAAKDDLDSQATLYSYRNINAPFDGYIIRRNFDPGHLLTLNSGDSSPLFIISDTSTARVFVYVPEEDIGVLRTGADVGVTTDAYPRKSFRGTVTRIAQGLDPATRTMQTEVDIANPEGELKPGMFARVNLQLYSHPDALTLPAGAVLRGENGSFVYTVSDGRAHRMPVQTGLQEGDTVEVTAGLGGGAQVVSSGWELLDDNLPVRVALTQPGTGPATP